LKPTAPRVSRTLISHCSTGFLLNKRQLRRKEAGFFPRPATLKAERTHSSTSTADTLAVIPLQEQLLQSFQAALKNQGSSPEEVTSLADTSEITPGCLRKSSFRKFRRVRYSAFK